MSDKPRELKKGDLLNVRVEGLGSFGEGLAHCEESEIFIPKSAPLDECEVEILEKKKGRYRAKIRRVIKPGPSRMSARCQHFEICGGCDFQHLSYEDQLSWKLRLTKHWIRRSPLGPLLEKIDFETISSPKRYAYRHRVRLQVKEGRLHYFKPHSNEVFEIKECPILVDGFFEALKGAALPHSSMRDWNQSFVDGQLVSDQARYSVGGEALTFDTGCFTQANLEVNELMWKAIERSVTTLSSYESALDLFCGIGNFTVPLSRYFKKTTGVESHASAIAWARKNSDQIRWMEGDADKTFAKLLQAREIFDFVLLDPPRMGALEISRLLHESFIPSIFYVSCNLETLIRDLTALLKKSRYRIESWTVCDLFPQTHHIESLVFLKKNPT